MDTIVKIGNNVHDWLNLSRKIDFLGPLALRLYLVPIFWMAGTSKLAHFESTVEWFEHGLELPLPYVMASLAVATEIAGAIFLLSGFAVRYISIPLIVTMMVAIFSVHLDNGWQAISGQGAPFANERVMESADKLEMAKEILQEYGNYEWLTGSGNFVILNNGIEFAMTYLIMLLMLMFSGAGRFTSIDYWIYRRFRTSKIVC
jgi:uncharacterized membrane protein YphA (DoxX/SURF4 family)